ncbi:unnamed protein product, partial [Allacma fusca]
FPKNKQISN